MNGLLHLVTNAVLALGPGVLLAQLGWKNAWRHTNRHGRRVYGLHRKMRHPLARMIGKLALVGILLLVIIPLCLPWVLSNLGAYLSFKAAKLALKYKVQALGHLSSFLGMLRGLR